MGVDVTTGLEMRFAHGCMGAGTVRQSNTAATGSRISRNLRDDIEAQLRALARQASAMPKKKEQ
jgi:hypothetical protein